MSTIILCGKSGSGKTTIGVELEKYGYKKLVTYTTRPMRKGEVNGVDYHFVTEDEFQKLLDNGKFAETASYNAEFGFCRYGSLKEDYGCEGKQYVILNPFGLKAVRKSGISATAIYVYADTHVLTKRLTKRGDSAGEITRRLAADERDFADIGEYVDFIIENNTTPADVAELIESICR
ncbi:MAG: guanylate kinase [Lachnospiraceae bacterium]|nr:guanylate kinase [Lachnospiraceae bacterium]